MGQAASVADLGLARFALGALGRLAVSTPTLRDAATERSRRRGQAVPTTGRDGHIAHDARERPMDDETRQDDEFYGREGLPTGEMQPLTEAEARARRGRNYAIAAGVVLFILLVYATTYFRFQDAVEAGLTG